MLACMHREHHDSVTAKRARSLRRQLTASELTVWGAVRNKQLGARFRRQEPIGPYIVDFVCLSHRLIVESDGSHHGGRYDRRRDEFLRSRGFTVLHVPAWEVLRDRDAVVDWIAAVIDSDPPTNRPAAD